MTKLLILEHSKSVRNNLCERLQFAGYDTTAVENADALAQLLGREQADLIIVDDAHSVPQCDVPFIVLSNPFSPFSASLWLTVLSTTGILVFYEPIKDWILSFKAFNSLEENGFRNSIIKATDACYDKCTNIK